MQTSSVALYTDLSGYYDLMCANIDYQTQSAGVQRLHQIFGNAGNTMLDLACGTGPHLRYFIDAGYQCSGLDLNLPMLELAKQRCPEAHFSAQNICNFHIQPAVDLITCFLYSIHYSQSLEQLKQCIQHVAAALTPGGLFCFNAVDKTKIDNNSAIRHSAQQENAEFEFESAWYYSGVGDSQRLQLQIRRTVAGNTEEWQDSHPMVAISFVELVELLTPDFEVVLLEHQYDTITPLSANAGNALVVCIKRPKTITESGLE